MLIENDLEHHGYARAYFHDGNRWRQRAAHRLIYEVKVGAIPDGKVLDHLCRRRNCVNWVHLEPVSIRTNVLRGVGTPAQRFKQTHCVNGHEFTPENTYRSPSRPGSRSCIACHRMWTRQRRARNETRQTA